MTKTRRSLMVLLFMTMVLGVGLFLPNSVSKSVKASSVPKVEFRTSRNLNWRLVPQGGSIHQNLGYAPFNWITLAVTQQKAYTNAYTPPRTTGIRGNFISQFNNYELVIFPAIPFSAFDNGSTITYFYRFDTNNGLRSNSSTTPLELYYDSNGNGIPDLTYRITVGK